MNYSEAVTLGRARGAESMIDFIYKLNEVLASWPHGSRWSMAQLSEATETSMPHVLQYLSESLGKDFDISGQLTQDEASEVAEFLGKRFRPQIEERERKLSRKRAEALEIYDRIQDRVRVIQASGNWHHAFRTLSYFTGQYGDILPNEVVITLCSDTVRAGIKSKANIQELGQWLQKAVAIALGFHSKQGIEEALDLIDAYGEYFFIEDSGKGPLLLGNILAVLEEPAARFELWEEYKSLVGQLYPAR